MGNSSSTPIFSMLPSELILDIAEFLEGESLGAFAATSKQARDIAVTSIDHREKTLKQGSLLVWQCPDSRSPTLCHASKLPHLRLSAQNVRKYNELISTCADGTASAVEKMLDDGALPNAPDAKNEKQPRLLTPLEAATHGNHHATIEVLLDRGAQPGRQTHYVEDLVQLFCCGDSDKRALSLVAKHRNTARIKDSLVKLSEIISIGHFSASKVSNLIDIGVWSDLPGPLTWRTPTGNVIVKTDTPTLEQDLGLVRLLLGDPVRRHSLCSPGRSPIHMACESNSPAVLKLLLDEFQADPNQGDQNPADAPLLAAAPRYRRKTAEHVKFLLEAGATIEGNTRILTRPFGDHAAMRLLFSAWISERGYQEPELLFQIAVSLGDVEAIENIYPLSSIQGSIEELPGIANSLYRATKEENTDLVDALLARVKTTKSALEDGLMYMLVYGDERKVQDLLSQPSFQVIFDEHRREMACLAAQHQPLAVLESLLELDPIPRERPPRHILDIFYTPTGRNTITNSNHPDTKAYRARDRLDYYYKGKNKILYRCFLAAVQAGHTGIVEALLKWCPDFARPITNDDSILSWATINNDLDLIKVLLAAGADVSRAYVNSELDIFNTWYRSDNAGPSMLCYAIYKGYTKIVEYLLDHGADVNSIDADFQQPLLSWAAWSGHIDIIRLLLSRGADVHYRETEYNRTPLFWAALRLHEPAARLLLDAGTDLNVVDTSEDECTPFSFAMLRGIPQLKNNLKKKAESTSELASELASFDLGIFRLFLERGARQSKSGNRIPFSEIFNLDVSPIVQLYLDLDLVTAECDQEGCPWVTRAVQNGSHTMVRAFVRAGFDICQKDRAGKTPLEYAGDDDKMVGALYCL